MYKYSSSSSFVYYFSFSFLVMDMFNFDFDTDSTLTNDTDSSNSTLDWSAFQSALPTIINNPVLSTCLPQQDDAVAPDNRSNVMITPLHDDEMYYEIEHFFNGLNQQQEQQGIIEPILVNIHVPDQIKYDINHIETPVSEVRF
jgi:hypothetical protein